MFQHKTNIVQATWLLKIHNDMIWGDVSTYLYFKGLTDLCDSKAKRSFHS